MMSQWLTAEDAQFTSKPLLASLLPLAVRRGVAVDKLLKGTAISTDETRNSTHRINAADALQLCQRAAQLIPDPQLWHLVAETMLSERLSPLVDVLLHAPTMAQALGYFSRYQNLLQPLQFALSSANQTYLQLYFMHSWGDSPSELSLALLIALGHQRGLALSEWRLGLPSHLRILPIWQKWQIATFTSPIPVLQIPKQQLRSKRLDRHPDRFQQAFWFCQIQSPTKAEPAFLATTFRWLQHQLATGQPAHLEALAATMQLSCSTCKRVLRKHGTSFQHQLDLVRLYQLLRLLQQRPYSNHELALKLGYSNPNNFRRACKRWLGVAPDLLRAQLL